MDDGGCLVHLHHERRLPASQIVGGAHPGEDAVAHWESGPIRRHEGADLGHEVDEAHLPEHRGLPRHVGAREDDDASVLVKGEVVGDERLGRHHRLHHRMPAGLDLHLEPRVDLRTDVLPPLRHVGQGREDVEAGGPGTRLLDAGHLGRHPPAHLAEELGLELLHAVLGAEDLLLPLLQLRREVALGVGQRLLADVVLGHLVEVRLGDLEVVSEDPVEADLE